MKNTDRPENKILYFEGGKKGGKATKERERERRL